MDLKKVSLLILFAIITCVTAFSQNAAALVQQVKAKLDQVNDYEATGRMKTNVSFLKVPEAQVMVYFRKPDNLKIKNEKGISLVPKGAVSMNLNNLLKGSYTALDAGKEKIGGKEIQIVKLLPSDDNGEIVLSTLYIDESRLVIVKAKTTTRESGSYEVELTYGKYEPYALPDKVVFTFNTKDYKLPKGITFDYDDGSTKKTANNIDSNKGRVEISYASYIINKGLPDAVFK